MKKPGTPHKCHHDLGFNCQTCWPTDEPTRPAVWPFKNHLGKATASEVPYSEPPPPTFRPSEEEDEALL